MFFNNHLMTGWYATHVLTQRLVPTRHLQKKQKEKHNLMAFLWHLSLKNKIKTKKRSSQLCSKCSCQLGKAGLQKFTEKWEEISLVVDHLTSKQAKNGAVKPLKAEIWELKKKHKHVALNKKSNIR